MTNAPKCKHIKKTCKACGWRSEGERKKTCPNCGADLRCGNYPVAGYTLCKSHGGPNPAADYYGAGTMTTGSSSQFPIVRLASKYKEMMRNGSVLSNRQTIDLLDIRIQQLLERVDFGEAPERIAKLYSLWSEYEEYVLARDDVNATISRRRLSDEFEKIYHDYNAWKQILEILDLRGKSVDREMKVLERIGALITMEEAYQMAAKMLGAAMKVIGDDPKKLKELQYEFVRITGERSDILESDDHEDDWRGSEEVGSEEGSGNVDQT